MPQQPQALTKNHVRKGQTQKKTSKKDCPFSLNNLPEQVHAQISYANQHPEQSETLNLQNKSKTTKVHNKTECSFSGSYNPLLGLSDPLPSHPEQATLIGQQFPVVTIPVIQKTVYSRPNPPSTILASQNFPPFPPDPGNPPQLTSP